MHFPTIPVFGAMRRVYALMIFYGVILARLAALPLAGLVIVTIGFDLIALALGAQGAQPGWVIGVSLFGELVAELLVMNFLAIRVFRLLLIEHDDERTVFDSSSLNRLGRYGGLHFRSDRADGVGFGRWLVVVSDVSTRHGNNGFWGSASFRVRGICHLLRWIFCSSRCQYSSALSLSRKLCGRAWCSGADCDGYSGRCPALVPIELGCANHQWRLCWPNLMGLLGDIAVNHCTSVCTHYFVCCGECRLF